MHDHTQKLIHFNDKRKGKYNQTFRNSELRKIKKALSKGITRITREKKITAGGKYNREYTLMQATIVL